MAADSHRRLPIQLYLEVQYNYNQTIIAVLIAHTSPGQLCKTADEWHVTTVTA